MEKTVKAIKVIYDDGSEAELDPDSLLDNIAMDPEPPPAALGTVMVATALCISKILSSVDWEPNGGNEEMPGENTVVIQRVEPLRLDGGWDIVVTVVPRIAPAVGTPLSLADFLLNFSPCTSLQFEYTH